MLLGPQLDYILEEGTEGVRKLGLAIGLSYDVSEHFLIDLHYSYGLTNRLEDDEDLDCKFSINYFQIGIGYRL